MGRLGGAENFSAAWMTENMNVTDDTGVVIGRVKWFDAVKGFGFVVADTGGPDILLHANVLRNFGQGSVADSKAKGFGFANAYADDEDIFLHIEVLRRCGLADLQAGEAVCLRVVDGERGKMAAEVHSWDYALTHE
jgi:CspA family cold shock protein